MKHDYRRITVNGTEFETDYNAPMAEAFKEANIYNRYSDIYAAYERPSQYKVNVWEEWCDWFNNTGDYAEWAISSKNCMKFTITGKVENANIQETGELVDLYLVITADHNRAWFLNK